MPVVFPLVCLKSVDFEVTKQIRTSGIQVVNAKSLIEVAQREGTGRVDINSRPAIVEEKRRFGDLTITADNGREFASHDRIACNLGIDFYFCRPYHSWERGANENMNGLIRQYLPKKTDMTETDGDVIRMIQDRLNNRPGKRLGWLTPIEMFKKLTGLDFIATAV